MTDTTGTTDTTDTSDSGGGSSGTIEPLFLDGDCGNAGGFDGSHEDDSTEGHIED